MTSTLDYSSLSGYTERLFVQMTPTASREPAVGAPATGKQKRSLFMESKCRQNCLQRRLVAGSYLLPQRKKPDSIPVQRRLRVTADACNYKTNSTNRSGLVGGKNQKILFYHAPKALRSHSKNRVGNISAILAKRETLVNPSPNTTLPRGIRT